MATRKRRKPCPPKTVPVFIISVKSGSAETPLEVLPLNTTLEQAVKRCNALADAFNAAQAELAPPLRSLVHYVYRSVPYHVLTIPKG